MFETVEWLKDHYVPLLIVAIAIGLVLIDYFFPTDFPAHIGYFLFAVGMFGILPWTYQICALVALGIWLSLMLLHHFCFRHFLTNAPGTNTN